MGINIKQLLSAVHNVQGDWDSLHEQITFSLDELAHLAKFSLGEIEAQALEGLNKDQQEIIKVFAYVTKRDGGLATLTEAFNLEAMKQDVDAKFPQDREKIIYYLYIHNCVNKAIASRGTLEVENYKQLDDEENNLLEKLPITKLVLEKMYPRLSAQYVESSLTTSEINLSPAIPSLPAFDSPTPKILALSLPQSLSSPPSSPSSASLSSMSLSLSPTSSTSSSDEIENIRKQLFVTNIDVHGIEVLLWTIKNKCFEHIRKQIISCGSLEKFGFLQKECGRCTDLLSAIKDICSKSIFNSSAVRQLEKNSIAESIEEQEGTISDFLQSIKRRLQHVVDFDEPLKRAYQSCQKFLTGKEPQLKDINIDSQMLRGSVGEFLIQISSGIRQLLSICDLNSDIKPRCYEFLKKIAQHYDVDENGESFEYILDLGGYANVDMVPKLVNEASELQEKLLSVGIQNMSRANSTSSGSTLIAREFISKIVKLNDDQVLDYAKRLFGYGQNHVVDKKHFFDSVESVIKYKDSLNVLTEWLPHVSCLLPGAFKCTRDEFTKYMEKLVKIYVKSMFVLNVKEQTAIQCCEDVFSKILAIASNQTNPSAWLVEIRDCLGQEISSIEQQLKNNWAMLGKFFESGQQYSYEFLAIADGYLDRIDTVSMINTVLKKKPDWNLCFEIMAGELWRNGVWLDDTYALKKILPLVEGVFSASKNDADELYRPWLNFVLTSTQILVAEKMLTKRMLQVGASGVHDRVSVLFDKIEAEELERSKVEVGGAKFNSLFDPETRNMFCKSAFSAALDMTFVGMMFNNDRDKKEYLAKLWAIIARSYNSATEGQKVMMSSLLKGKMQEIGIDRICAIIIDSGADALKKANGKWAAVGCELLAECVFGVFNQDEVLKRMFLSERDPSAYCRSSDLRLRIINAYMTSKDCKNMINAACDVFKGALDDLHVNFEKNKVTHTLGENNGDKVAIEKQIAAVFLDVTNSVLQVIHNPRVFKVFDYMVKDINLKKCVEILKKRVGILKELPDMLSKFPDMLKSCSELSTKKLLDLSAKKLPRMLKELEDISKEYPGIFEEARSITKEATDVSKRLPEILKELIDMSKERIDAERLELTSEQLGQNIGTCMLYTVLYLVNPVIFDRYSENEKENARFLVLSMFVQSLGKMVSKKLPEYLREIIKGNEYLFLSVNILPFFYEGKKALVEHKAAFQEYLKAPAAEVQKVSSILDAILDKNTRLSQDAAKRWQEFAIAYKGLLESQQKEYIEDLLVSKMQEVGIDSVFDVLTGVQNPIVDGTSKQPDMESCGVISKCLFNAFDPDIVIQLILATQKDVTTYCASSSFLIYILRSRITSLVDNDVIKKICHILTQTLLASGVVCKKLSLGNEDVFNSADNKAVNEFAAVDTFAAVDIFVITTKKLIGLLLKDNSSVRMIFSKMVVDLTNKKEAELKKEDPESRKRMQAIGQEEFEIRRRWFEIRRENRQSIGVGHSLEEGALKSRQDELEFERKQVKVRESLTQEEIGGVLIRCTNAILVNTIIPELNKMALAAEQNFNKLPVAEQVGKTAGHELVLLSAFIKSIGKNIDKNLPTHLRDVITKDHHKLVLDVMHSFYIGDEISTECDDALLAYLSPQDVQMKQCSQLPIMNGMSQWMQYNSPRARLTSVPVDISSSPSNDLFAVPNQVRSFREVKLGGYRNTMICNDGSLSTAVASYGSFVAQNIQPLSHTSTLSLQHTIVQQPDTPQQPSFSTSFIKPLAQTSSSAASITNDIKLPLSVGALTMPPVSGIASNSGSANESGKKAARPKSVFLRVASGFFSKTSENSNADLAQNQNFGAKPKYRG